MPKTLKDKSGSGKTKKPTAEARVCKASENHKALGAVVLGGRCYQPHCPPTKWEMPKEAQSRNEETKYRSGI